MATIQDLMTNPAPDDTSNKKRLIKDTLVEFLATTVFIYTSTLAAVSTGRKLMGQGVSEDVGRILPIALAFGISIMSLAFAMGHLTGGHMNPAVSLMMFFKRQISIKRMLCYWFAQFLGALLGSAILWGSVNTLSSLEKPDGEQVMTPPLLLGSNTLAAPLNAGNGFLLEFMGSFFFFFVIAQTALDKRGIANTPFPAIPIGFVLVIVHIGLIPLTGCGVNPARTFGPSMISCMASKDNCEIVVGSWYWIYWAGPFAAAFVVAEVTTWMQDDDEEASNGATEESAGLVSPKTAPMDKDLDISFAKVDMADA